MKPAPFEYQAPSSLDTALDVLVRRSGEAKLLAGGQSLIPVMNFRLAEPALLVDINKLTELDFIRRDEDGGLRIGALTRQRRLERDLAVAEAAPLLHETMPCTRRVLHLPRVFTDIRRERIMAAAESGSFDSGPVWPKVEIEHMIIFGLIFLTVS